MKKKPSKASLTTLELKTNITNDNHEKLSQPIRKWKTEANPMENLKRFSER